MPKFIDLTRGKLEKKYSYILSEMDPRIIVGITFDVFYYICTSRNPVPNADMKDFTCIDWPTGWGLILSKGQFVEYLGKFHNELIRLNIHLYKKNDKSDYHINGGKFEKDN